MSVESLGFFPVRAVAILGVRFVVLAHIEHIRDPDYRTEYC